MSGETSATSIMLISSSHRPEASEPSSGDKEQSSRATSRSRSPASSAANSPTDDTTTNSSPNSTSHLQPQQDDRTRAPHIQLQLSAEEREELCKLASSYSADNDDEDGHNDEEDEDSNNNNESRANNNYSDSPGEQRDLTSDNAEQTVELRMLVRRREAGALIGRRGANIKRLREQFRNSMFSIPDTGNGPERVVCVATDRKSMGPILDDITEILVKKSPENDCQLELKLLIHSSQAGSIIGLSGQSIKKLRNDSKAAIKIYELCCPFSSERVCAIKAKPPVVVRTIKLIQSILSQNPIKETSKPYDALHFDVMLADKYGGYLPDDGPDMMLSAAAARHPHYSNHQNHQHHHQHHYPAYHHHRDFEPMPPIQPPPPPIGGFSRAPMRPEQAGCQPISKHYSVWRSPEFHSQCSDMSCISAPSPMVRHLPASQDPRLVAGKLHSASTSEPPVAKQLGADQCEHHHDHFVSMSQLMGAYVAATAAARSQQVAGARFHPYAQVYAGPGCNVGDYASSYQRSMAGGRHHNVGDTGCQYGPAMSTAFQRPLQARPPLQSHQQHAGVNHRGQGIIRSAASSAPQMNEACRHALTGGGLFEPLAQNEAAPQVMTVSHSSPASPGEKSDDRQRQSASVKFED